MRLTLLPFGAVQAFCDIETQEMFVNTKFCAEFETNIRHEVAHILSGDPDHGHAFNDQHVALGGSQVVGHDLFKTIRRRLGINPCLSANIGNISGIQNILTDYHLLQAYRKFSQKILGTEGHWEVINEVDGEAKDQLLRLYPTPKGAFPVLVLYYPVVQHFRSPQARLVAYEYMLAEAKETLGRSLRKLEGMPSPDGGTVTLDGAALVSEAIEKKKELLELAINLGEPALVYTW